MDTQNLKDIVTVVAQIVMGNAEDFQKIAEITRLLIASQVITNNIY